MALGLGVVFDLDDTLYLERHYVASGFRSVAYMLSDSVGIEAETIYSYLMGLFRAGQRGQSFDRLLEEFPNICRAYTVRELVDAYRMHTPRIHLLPKINTLLYSLRNAGIRLGLVSDGNLASQRAKVEVLRLNSRLDLIVLTDAWGREYWKPHPRGFQYVEEVWGLGGPSLVYVGDNPAKDFVTPNRMGWRTVRLRLSGQLHYEEEPPKLLFAPEIEVSSVTELAKVLLSTETGSDGLETRS